MAAASAASTGEVAVVGSVPSRDPLADGHGGGGSGSGNSGGGDTVGVVAPAVAAVAPSSSTAAAAAPPPPPRPPYTSNDCSAGDGGGSGGWGVDGVVGVTPAGASRGGGGGSSSSGSDGGSGGSSGDSSTDSSGSGGGGSTGAGKAAAQAVTLQVEEDGIAVAVIGSGMYGRSFARNAASCGIPVVVGSRRHRSARRAPAWASPAPIVCPHKALAAADVVVLAIPAAAHAGWVAEYAALLGGKVLVDVANPVTPSVGAAAAALVSPLTGALGRCVPLGRRQRQGAAGAAPAPVAGGAAASASGRGLADDAGAVSSTERLVAAVAAAGIPRCEVVKAFNNVPAYALDEPAARQPPPLVQVSGNGEAAKAKVLSLARSMGYPALDTGGVRCARTQEAAVHRFFNAWVGSVIFAAALLVVWTVYWASRYYAFDRQSTASWWWTWLLVPVGDMSALLLAATFLPGSVAALVQLGRGTAARPFPRWLALWMGARKQLGLLGFWFGLLHSFAAAANGFPRRTATFEPLPDHYRYWAAGVVALGLYWVLSSASTGSTAAALSWAEFRFLFSWLGLATVGVTLLHVGVLVRFYSQHDDANPVQTVFLTFGVLGLAGVAMLALKLPPLSLAVRRVRSK